jgi:hypothetical protein
VREACKEAIAALHIDAEGKEIKWFRRDSWFEADATGDQAKLDRIQAAVQQISAHISADPNVSRFYEEDSALVKDTVYALTRAPSGYDYSYVFELGVVQVVDYDDSVKEFRLLALADRYRALNFQIPRYWSGVYATYVVPALIAEELHEKRVVKIGDLERLQVRTQR